MTKLLIALGLVLTPFFVVPGLDVRDVKLTVAVNMALALGLSGLYEGYVKKLNNVWLYIFLFYSLFSYVLAPNPSVYLMGINVGYFWVWQPMYNFLVFGLALIVIASIPYTKRDIEIGINIMVWCGLVMSLYVICQKFNYEQFFANVGLDDLGRIAGSIGNPTHVSPYIAMLVPLALYLRRYLFAIIMGVAVHLTTSDVAMAALVIGLLVYIFLFNKKILFWGSLVIALIVSIYSIYFYNNYDTARNQIHDNQRFIVNGQIIQDLNEKPFKDCEARYPLTGWGMGNFRYTFHFAHQEHDSFKRFHQAHNEYFELLYNIGIIGFVLFLITIYGVFKDKLILFYHKGINSVDKALLSSFAIVCVSAFGTFIWQVGTVSFYSIVVAGLLYNTEVTNA